LGNALGGSGVWWKSGRHETARIPGAQLGEILADTRSKGLTVNIKPKGPATVEEIMDALRPILEAAKFARN